MLKHVLTLQHVTNAHTQTLMAVFVLLQPVGQVVGIITAILYSDNDV